MTAHNYDDMPSLDTLAPDADVRTRRAVSNPVSAASIQSILANHPAPALAWLETAIWLLLALTVVDHLANNNGTIGTITWWLTIGQHEIGHLLFSPLGTLLMFLGGTIFQILFWLLIGVWEGFVRRRLRVLLVCAVITGHSFINAAVYIGDARARSLPLLFGMSSDHHDWYNILNMLGLLPFDTALALLARVVGILIIFAAAGAGIYFAWMAGIRRIQPAAS